MAKNSLVVVIAIVVVVAAVFYLYQYNPQTIKQQIKLTGIEVAEKTISFAESMKNDDGTYNLGESCNVDTLECTKIMQEGAGFDVNILVADAYGSLFDATAKDKYKQAYERESKFILENCLDNSSVSCNGLIGLLVKEYKVSSDQKSLDILKATEGNLVFYTNATGELKTPVAFDAPASVSIARDLVSIYSLTKNEETKKAAEYYLNSVNESFDVSSPGLYSNPVLVKNGVSLYTVSCRNKLAVLDVYSITSKAAYLEGVKSFFDGLKLPEDAGNISNSIVLDCAAALQKLSEVAEVDAYRQEAISLAQQSLKRWDYDGGTDKITGDNGFLDMNNLGRGEKTVKDAVSAIAVFSKFANVRFDVE